MAIGSNLIQFEDGQAWVQVNYDDQQLNVVSVVYQNATNQHAYVHVSEGNRSDDVVCNPGAGVPTPITQGIQPHKYTYRADPDDPTGILPNFLLEVSFRA